MEYLEEISWELEKLNLPAGDTEEVQRLIVGAFKDGLARRKPTNQLEGYSNLTAAISAGESIDWEELEGLNVQFVKPGVGTLRGTLERDALIAAELPGAWWNGTMDAYATALRSGWRGENGWTLWLEGEVPLRRKTADQLEPGYFFTGVLSGTTSESLMCVAGELGNVKRVRYASDFMPSHHPANKWEVIEEHGPFQKPEGK